MEQHIEECADCREEVAIWKKLSLLPVEQPSAGSRERFEAMLHAYQTGRNEKASAGIERAQKRTDGVELVAFAGGRGGLERGAARRLEFLRATISGTEAPRSNNGQNEIAAMHTELANMKQMVVLSMLQQQSASERLQGVSYSRREDQLDPQVMSALVHTLRYDGSVDVRLAALDALSRHGAQPQVHKGVVDALQEQQSPLVQVALID